MNRKIRIPLFVFLAIVFSVCSVFVLAQTESLWQTSLSITSGPSFYGPQDKVYTKWTDENGNITWTPSNPATITIYLDASLSGGGDAKAVISSATIGSTSWSLPNTSTSRIGTKRISDWVDNYGSTSRSLSATCSTSPGTYRWSASGYVETTTYELERTVETGWPTGGHTTTWVILATDTTSVQDGSSGSWTIEEGYKCSKCTFTTTSSTALSNHSCTLCSGCNLMVPSPNRHAILCNNYLYRVHTAAYPNGHYYTCNPASNNLHKPRTCVRRSLDWSQTCGQTFHDCLPKVCQFNRDYWTYTLYCSDLYY